MKVTVLRRPQAGLSESSVVFRGVNLRLRRGLVPPFRLRIPQVTNLGSEQMSGGNNHYYVVYS